MFPGQVPGKFRESSGKVPEKVPGKFRKSSGKVPEIPGKFRKLRVSSERRFGNWFGLEILAEPKVQEIPGEFRKFRGRSGNSGEVLEKFRASSERRFRKPSGTGGDNHVAVPQSSRNLGCSCLIAAPYFKQCQKFGPLALTRS